MKEFEEFPKIARLSRECVISEKLDGTNASVFIPEDGTPMLFGSRTRWITPEDDNYGFAKWATEHMDGLRLLGSGHHFGEWWGQGVQRKYGLKEKRFSLFDTGRWLNTGDQPTNEKQGYAPACCHVVPVLYQGLFCSAAVDLCLENLRLRGSAAAPGFMQPEGVVIWHTTARQLLKKTLEKDAEPKGLRR